MASSGQPVQTNQVTPELFPSMHSKLFYFSFLNKFKRTILIRPSHDLKSLIAHSRLQSGNQPGYY